MHTKGESVKSKNQCKSVVQTMNDIIKLEKNDVETNA
jgi:hypothetical protein